MTKQEIATYYAKKFTPDNISGGEMVALKAMDAFSERPISEQSYWYEIIVPTNDCKVLLNELKTRALCGRRLEFARQVFLR